MAELNYQILYPDIFALLHVTLRQGQSLNAESNAMAAMSDTIDVAGNLQGGLFGGLRRRLMGESVEYTVAKAARGWMSSATSGEGWTCQFRGPGKVMIQTRKQADFANWLQRLMAQRQDGQKSIGFVNETDRGQA